MRGLTSNGLLVTGGMVVAGLVTGLLSFGLYGKLREKKWGTWKAGALTGALGGLLGGLGIWAMLPYYYAQYPDQLSGLTMDPMNGLGQIEVTQLPKIVAGLTMSKLSGLQVNGLSMSQLPLGSYAVDPRTLQLV